MEHPVTANGVPWAALDVHSIPSMLDHIVFNKVLCGVPKVQACATFARLQLLASVDDVGAQDVSLRVVEINPIKDVPEFVAHNDISTRLEQDAGILRLEILTTMFENKAANRALISQDRQDAASARPAQDGFANPFQVQRPIHNDRAFIGSRRNLYGVPWQRGGNGRLESEAACTLAYSQHSGTEPVGVR